MQQDGVAQRLARQQQEQEARVREIEKNVDDALKVDGDDESETASGNEEQKEGEQKDATTDSALATEKVSEDYLGRQIDICK